LSDPATPQSNWNFISLTYDLFTGVTAAFIGVHNAVAEGNHADRLHNTTPYWAQPLLLVIIMLDEQMSEISQAIAGNNRNVSRLEKMVGNFADLRHTKYLLDGQKSITELMDGAHTVARENTS